jgi:hypothetical protein
VENQLYLLIKIVLSIAALWLVHLMDRCLMIRHILTDSRRDFLEAQACAADKKSEMLTKAMLANAFQISRLYDQCEVLNDLPLGTDRYCWISTNKGYRDDSGVCYVKVHSIDLSTSSFRFEERIHIWRSGTCGFMIDPSKDENYSRGYGSLAMSTFLDLIRAEGNANMLWGTLGPGDARYHHRSIPFYKKHGFQVTYDEERQRGSLTLPFKQDNPIPVSAARAACEMLV